MSITQTEVLEIQKVDKKSHFFNENKKISSGAPDPNPPQGSKTTVDDDNESFKGCRRGCTIS